MGLPVSEVLQVYDKMSTAEQRKVLEVALEPHRLLHSLVPDFFYERQGRKAKTGDFVKWLEERHPGIANITGPFGEHNIVHLFESHCQPPELEAVKKKGLAHERIYKGRE